MIWLGSNTSSCMYNTVSNVEYRHTLDQFTRLIFSVDDQNPIFTCPVFLILAQFDNWSLSSMWVFLPVDYCTGNGSKKCMSLNMSSCSFQVNQVTAGGRNDPGSNSVLGSMFSADVVSTRPCSTCNHVNSYLLNHSQVRYLFKLASLLYQ